MSKREYSARVQWQGKSWRLRVVDQILPDGTTAEKGVIDHPGSVVIVPLDGEQVLMLRQYRLSLDQGILELPAGTREGDEPWLTCAQRELREETGYQAAEWISLGSEITYGINTVAEPGRLQISIGDEHGRLKSVRSVDLVRRSGW